MGKTPTSSVLLMEGTVDVFDMLWVAGWRLQSCLFLGLNAGFGGVCRMVVEWWWASAGSQLRLPAGEPG